VTRDLVSGVISSLLVVLFVEGYLRLRRHYHRRSLREALGNPRSATVVASAFPVKSGPSTISLMATHDSYAMAHLLAAFYAIGVKPSVLSVAALPDGLDDDIVCIGGPAVNRLTKSHLSAFCPGFDWAGDVMRCGSHEFAESEDRSWGFLVRLAPRQTGRLHMTTLVWGIGALGTSGAAYFLAEIHRSLPRVAGTESFFVAVPIQRAVGYQGVSTATIDLSADVWAS
jgi:hypothetical protein